MSRSSLQREGKRGGLSFLAAKIDEKHRMKESIGNHRTGLPPHLLNLFQGRPTPQYLEPFRKKKPTLPISGVAAYTEQFEVPEKPAEEHQPPLPTAAAEQGNEEQQQEEEMVLPSTVNNESPQKIFLNPEYALQVRLDSPTRLERMVAAKKESLQRHKEHLDAAIADYKPSEDPNIEGDPLKTLFIARLAPDAISERKLRREFEEFGPIKRIQIIHDKKTGTPRGYAFIEFEDKDDMKEAYKCTDGMRIEGTRVLVDVERGRTVPGWLPCRLGGGRGDARAARLPKDPVVRRIKGIVNRLAGVEETTGGGGDGGGMAFMDEERERGRGDRGDRDRDGGRNRGRDRRDYRDRDRDSGRKRDGRRDRDTDDYGVRRDTRKRDRGYDGYQHRDRVGGGGDFSLQYPPGGRDYGGEAYNTVPPPLGMQYPPVAPPPGAAAVPMGADDEPEEGEFVEADVVGGEEGEREPKRLRSDAD